MKNERVGSEVDERTNPLPDLDNSTRARLLTVKEVACALRLGPTTVWHLIMAGEIESVVCGRRARRVPPEAVDAYVARLREQVRWLGTGMGEE
jgi:excisionase family DNA binding protein